MIEISKIEFPLNFKRNVEEFENILLRYALEKTKGNKRQAAKLLGLKRTTLIEKIKKKKKQGIILFKKSSCENGCQSSQD